MPRLGESVTEGTVTRWLKKEGDQVTADEPLLEVSTDKVDTEVPSPASGVLSSIKVAEDETVEIGVELAVISDGAQDSGAAAPAQEQAPAEQAPAAQAPAAQAPAAQAPAEQAPAAQAQPEPAQAPAGESADQPAAHAVVPDPAPAAAPAEAPVAAAPPAAPPQSAPAAPQAPAAPPQSAPAAPQAPPATSASAQQAEAQQAAADDDEVAGTYVTPLVRKLASEHGVDLNSLTGTGVGGRIRKSDVLSAANAAAEADAEEQAVSPAPAPPVSAPAATEATPPAHAGTPSPAASGLRGQTVKMSRLRQVIAARMVESLQTSAQLTTVVEVDITRISRLRAQAKDDFAAREGVKLSFLPFFAVAAVEALKAHPNVNASVDTEAGTITYYDAEHLGIAVDTDRGLLVPVIHNAGDLNLAGIARKIADLAERTRTNKVSPDELGGGTFTLTNTGSRGALFDTPIINQPQVGILGTGAVVKRPVVISDPNLGETIAIRSMVYLALSYDHRIVDGADAARFLTTMKERLEAGMFERALGLA
jgi:2-oxoglutarate dehydrogenase E2 component (dihydrolipoamide succinyltransferase)